MPKTPDGHDFFIGADPHPMTAYISPNDGRAYGLAGIWGVNYTMPTYLGVIDLEKLLSAPRCSGNSI